MEQRIVAIPSRGFARTGYHDGVKCLESSWAGEQIAVVDAGNSVRKSFAMLGVVGFVLWPKSWVLWDPLRL